MNTFKKLGITLIALCIFALTSCNEDDPFGGNNPKSGYVSLENENITINQSGKFSIPVNLNTSINPNGVNVSYTIESTQGNVPNTFSDISNGNITIKSGEIISNIELDIPNTRESFSLRLALTGTDDSSFSVGLRDGSKVTSADIMVNIDFPKTQINFQSTASNLEVPINDQNTIDIPISVSTTSDSDRTVTIEVEPLPSGTADAAMPNQYSFTNEVLIPANQFFGILKLTGIDNGLEVGETVRLQLKITQANFIDTNILDEIHTVSISQVCPLPDDYLVGNYRLNSPLANVWCNAPRPSFIGDGIDVVVAVGSTSSQRVFTSRYTPGSCDAFSNVGQFIINLSCNQATLGANFNTGVFCGGAEVVITNNPGNIANYDISDDSSITINVIETPGGTCSVMPTNQTFTLTRL